MLELSPVSFSTAAEFVAAYHRHHNAPQSWKFGQALYRDGWIVGVVIIGRPSPRHYDDSKTVEITRLSLSDHIPNASSMLYSWAYREAHRRGYKRIYTYTRIDETGASLRASNWIPHHLTAGRSFWNIREGRPGGRKDTPRRVMWIPEHDRKLWPEATYREQ